MNERAGGILSAPVGNGLFGTGVDTIVISTYRPAALQLSISGV